MDTQQPQQSDPAVQARYDHLVQSLRAALPPPMGRTPEDIARRNAAAIDLAVSLAPADAAEVALTIKYVVAGAHADHCLWLALRHPPTSGMGLRLRTQDAGFIREGQRNRSLLLTMQEERQRRAATTGAAQRTPPSHSGGQDADSLASPGDAVAALPAQPPAPPGETKPAPARRPRPALRLIQGGLAS